MKITVCCIVKNEEFFLPMMINSALQFADEIIIVDDNSTDNTEAVVKNFENKKIKYFKYAFGQHFGKGRQFAHDKATGDWVVWLDADEVIHESLTVKFKEFLIEKEKEGFDVISVQYIHFIHHFGLIDNSEAIHSGIYRMYKNYKGVDFLYRKNHALPSYKFKKAALCPNIVYFHLGYLRGMVKIHERFHRNFYYSEMHSPYQQVYWRDWHYFGDYPTKKFDVKFLPKVIKDHFEMEVGGSTR